MLDSIPQIRGKLDGSGRRFGIVAATYNQRLVTPLIEGAVETLLRHGVEASAVQLVRVPGAWELPQAADELAHLGTLDGLIAIGVVVRGETPHFDYICGECAAGLGRVASKHRVPVAFGVLTCDSSSQAEERAGGKSGNKGSEAALAALEMASLFGDLRT